MTVVVESVEGIANNSPSAASKVAVRPVSIALAVGLLLYRFVLDLVYESVVGVSYAYQGFQNESTAQTLLLSWLFLLALMPLMVRVLRSEALASQLTSLLVLLSLVPTTTLIAYNPSYHIEYVVLIFVYWLVFLLACLWIPAIKPFRRPIRSEVPHLLMLALMVGTIMFISWRFTGFRLHFGLFDVYELRAEAREFEVATTLGYIAAIGDNLLPVLLAFYLRRHWLLVAAAVAVVILFNFGIAATKQVLFLLVLGVASYAVNRNGRFNRKVLLGLGVVIVGCIVEHQTIGTIFLTELSVYRLMFLPAHLHWVHYDFFQTNELLFLTQSALKFFFESPYEENVQFLLGDYFIGEIEARANNGLFSDGYMNFGAASVAFYPLLAVFLLKLVEGAAEGLSASVKFMLLMSLAFVFLGVPLPTAVLSSGVGALLFLLPTLPRQDAGSAAASRTL
jgi:hypothetical protein